MSISGPAPKDGPKHGRHKSEYDAAKVEVSTPVAAPALPGAEDYDERTRVWYSTWADAPQNAIFTSTDWQRLHMLAPLVDRYYRTVSDPKAKLYSLTNLLAEIRQNEALLGATHVDRLKGRIKVSVDDGPAGGTPKLAVLADYRALLADGDD